MGGPSCRIFLDRGLQPAEVLCVGALLGTLGEAKFENGLWTIVGAPEARGHPCVELSIGQPSQESDPDLDRVTRALGWAPGQAIWAWGTTRAPGNHRFLGGIALALAERFRGWVHLVTICDVDEQGPPPPADVQDRMDRFVRSKHPEDRDLPDAKIEAIMKFEAELAPWMAELKQWHRKKVLEQAALAPGRVVEIEDAEGESTYLVDADYLRHWMADPGFYFE